MEIPEWLRIAKHDSCLTSRDISKLLGISTFSIKRRASKGQFPKPDWERGATYYWKVATIRGYMADPERFTVIGAYNGKDIVI